MPPQEATHIQVMVLFLPWDSTTLSIANGASGVVFRSSHVWEFLDFSLTDFTMLYLSKIECYSHVHESYKPQKDRG